MDTFGTWGHTVITALELTATAAFALSGAIEAMRKKMDVVGVCVCGFLAAFGGGTLRDVLLDRRPFFWVDHQYALVGVFLLCIAALSFMRQRHVALTEKSLQWPDAIGLGLFCATGVHLAWSMGLPALVAILMGVVTGTFGGVMRDVVCNQMPALFNDHRPYALCAFAGGLAYTTCRWIGADESLGLMACALLSSGLRLLTLWFNWRLPVWQRR